MIREIVKIDEELCDGCGECIPNCHEGALQIIDGKARLISELMCDGLGACLGHCPQGAITIEKREADDYDEEIVIGAMLKSGKSTVFAHLKHLQEHNETAYLRQALNYLKAHRDELPFTIAEVHELLHGRNNGGYTRTEVTGGCPGSTPINPNSAQIRYNPEQREKQSELTQWPVQLHLINPDAHYFTGAHLLVAADCTAYAYANFQQRFLKDRKLVIACPKLDQDTGIYVEKLRRLIDNACVETITVVVMEVPCCRGLIGMIQAALMQAEKKVPVKVAVVSIDGTIKSEEWI